MSIYTEIYNQYAVACCVGLTAHEATGTGWVTQAYRYRPHESRYIWSQLRKRACARGLALSPYSARCSRLSAERSLLCSRGDVPLMLVARCRSTPCTYLSLMPAGGSSHAKLLQVTPCLGPCSLCAPQLTPRPLSSCPHVSRVVLHSNKCKRPSALRPSTPG